MENVESAWSYFNCDEKIFRVLLKNQDRITISIFSKKWGKNYDGMNVLKEMKKSDLILFRKLIENFKLELDYVQNVMLEGKNLDDISKMVDNHEISLIERCMMKYNVSREMIIDCLNCLNENNRNCLIYYYGIERSRLSADQICKMCNIDISDLSSYVQKSELNLTSYIRMKRDSELNKSRFAKENNDNKTPVNESIAIQKTISLESTTHKSKEEKSDCVSKILNRKPLRSFERMILYTKLMNIDDEVIDQTIMDLYQISLDDMVMCYINNLELFEDVNYIVNQIINYDQKYIREIFNSKYYESLLKEIPDEERCKIYNELVEKTYCKKKK